MTTRTKGASLSYVAPKLLAAGSVASVGERLLDALENPDLFVGSHDQLELSSAVASNAPSTMSGKAHQH